MKEEHAREVHDELRDELGRGWSVIPPEKEVDEHRRRVKWSLTVSQRNSLGPNFRFPEVVMKTALDHDLFIQVDASNRRVKLTLDNMEANELEFTEEEKARRQLESTIRSEFNVNRAVVEALADEFDSVDEIVTASREELTAINGIGERRATEILHRRSDKLKQRIKGTNNNRTIEVIEDKDGILRLPEEYEDGDYTPKFNE